MFPWFAMQINYLLSTWLEYWSFTKNYLSNPPFISIDDLMHNRMHLSIISLREKCPNTEFFLFRIFPHSDWIKLHPSETLFVSRYAKEQVSFTKLCGFKWSCLYLALLNDHNCVKSFHIWSYSNPYSVRMRKYTDQENSEYGHFSNGA